MIGCKQTKSKKAFRRGQREEYGTLGGKTLINICGQGSLAVLHLSVQSLKVQCKFSGVSRCPRMGKIPCACFSLFRHPVLVDGSCAAEQSSLLRTASAWQVGWGLGEAGRTGALPSRVKTGKTPELKIPPNNACIFFNIIDMLSY